MKRNTTRISIPRRNRILLFIKKRILACLSILLLTFVSIFVCILYVYNKTQFVQDREGRVKEEFQWKDMTNTTSRKCENYHQGPHYILVDDLGNICNVNRVGRNGCCDAKSDAKVFFCDTCNQEGCCREYEHCVSCCLHPNNERNLRNIMKNPVKCLQHIIKKVKNQFQLCLAKCRTSSESVINQKIYKNFKYKYCFKQFEKEYASLDLDKDGFIPH